LPSLAGYVETSTPISATDDSIAFLGMIAMRRSFSLAKR